MRDDHSQSATHAVLILLLIKLLISHFAARGISTIGRALAFCTTGQAQILGQLCIFMVQNCCLSILAGTQTLSK